MSSDKLTQTETQPTGWNKQGGDWYYYKKDGKKATGWQNIKGAKYFFDEAGIMQTGWFTQNNNTYFCAHNGKLTTGWNQYDCFWYYMDPQDGHMLTGWQTISDSRYYFAKDGKMVTGWQTLNDNKYYFGDNGIALLGWQKINGSWYYFQEDNSMATGWLELSGSTYYLGTNGKMVTGQKEIDHAFYQFEKSGKLVDTLHKIPKEAPNNTPASEEKTESSSSNEVVIAFDNVTKTYHLYKNEVGRFMGLFSRLGSNRIVENIDANKNLSFEIHRGEAVALLGNNGAGKSTALKMITGVIYPTSGTVTVRGRVSALLELTTGFDSQLTGRENLKMRSKVLGLSDEEFKAIEEDAIDFADIGVYIDQPLRMYSSGMKSRLGFAFAVAIDPEILIIDEALSVGDKAFSRKCLDRVQKIVANEDVTVLFVTHASSSAKEFCTRGIVLDRGEKVYDGPIAQAIAFYNKMN